MRTDVGFTVTTERNQQDSVAVVMINDVGVRFAIGKAIMGTLPSPYNG